MSKVLWTAKDAAKATGGKAVGNWTASGLSIDSRSIGAGDMFVPLKDARDGHDFIDSARAGGASVILSERKDEAAPALIVDDTMAALHDLAVAARERCAATRIAVTGSVGKTSVKEALAHMFSAFGHTHKSIKSFNNHWGVPLTLAAMAQDTEYAVFETGMNHAGELTALSKIVAPHIALITTVAPAHLAHFKSVEDIADAKAEIMLGIAPDGVLILNADNEYTPRIIAQAEVRAIKYITFGHADSCEVQIVSSDTHSSGSDIKLSIGGTKVDLALSVPGEHWVSNAAACMAVAYACDLDLSKAAMQLRNVGAEAGRGLMHLLSIDDKNITLIDDSYNANPASMRAAISVLGAQSGRRLAVLGDMFELGKDELALHAALSAPLEAAGVSRVFVTGECMRALRGAMPRPMRAAWTPNWEQAAEALRGELQDGDVILVKGSNGVGLSKLVAHMVEIGRAQKGTG